MPNAPLAMTRRQMLFSAGALGAPLLSLAAAPQPATLDVAFYPVAGMASMVVGEQQGFFAAEGLTLKKEKVLVPADAIANLVGGRLQVAVINVGGLSQAAVQGLPLKVIAPMYFTTGARDSALYVKADSPIRSMSDLKGKSLAMLQLKNNVHAAVLQQIDAAGVDPSTVKFSLIPAPNIVGALRAGSIDVAQVVEPFATMAGDSIRSICDNPFSLIEKRTVIAHYVTTQQVARDKQVAIAGFARGLTKGHRFSAQNPDSVRKAIGSFTEIPPDVLAKILLPVFDVDMAQDSVNRQVDVMVKYKILQSRPDLAPFFA